MTSSLEPGQIVGVFISGIFWVAAVVFLMLYKFQLKRRDLILMIVSFLLAGVISVFSVAPEKIGFAVILAIPGVGIGGVLVLAVGLCRRQLRPWNIWFKVYMLLAACVSPPVTLFFWEVASIDNNHWKGTFDHKWYKCLDTDQAGLTLLPLLVVNCIVITVAIFKTSFREKSHGPWFASALNALICLWSTGYTIFSSGNLFGHPGSSPAWGPAIMVVGFALLTLRFWRELNKPVPPFSFPFFFWFFTYVGSILVKIPLAKAYYEALPDQPPAGCFIVSASAHGHASFVGSQFDDELGYPINQQLRTYRKLEEYLIVNWPRTHRLLRFVYNRVGPVVAAQIRYRVLADIMYILLKPGEWLIRSIV